MDSERNGGRPENLGWELTKGFAGRLIRAKVARFCRRFGLDHATGEDLQQTLRVELLIRSKRFDPARGTWRAFISTVTEHAAATQFRRLARAPRHRSLDAVDGARQWRVDRSPHESDLRQDVALLSAQLHRDRQLLIELLRVWNVSEVARQLGVPRSTLADRVRALRQPFASLDPKSSDNRP